VRVLLRDMVRDQALMLQLTPEAMEVFNAAVGQRPGVRCGSVVAQAACPSLRTTIGAGLDPVAQITRALYGVLHRLAAATPRHLSPRLTPEQARTLRHVYGAIPSVADSDGIVPTRCQAWEDILYAANADHLDVLGHFRDASQKPPHVDWLVTGSGFDRHHFEALWGDVAGFIAGEHAGAELVHASAAGSLDASRTSLGAKHARAS